jgi:imidazolonepropionase-like amidohydrolase
MRGGRIPAAAKIGLLITLVCVGCRVAITTPTPEQVVTTPPVEQQVTLTPNLATPTPGQVEMSTPTASADAGPLALVNGVLIDGTGADPIPDAALVIRAGRIAAVGSRTAVEIPADARVIDVNGATLLPGLINAHVHSAFDVHNLEMWGKDGVTTVRDLANSTFPRLEPIAKFRETVRDYPQAARLVTVGPMVTVPGGYPIAIWGVPALTVTSPIDARQKVTQLLDAGVDVIKISLESGGIFGQTIPTLSPEQAQAIVEMAHARSTLVSAHVSISADLEKALAAGVDDMAHMSTDPVPDALIQRMVKADVYWVPTIELWKGVGLGEHVIDNLRRYVAAGGLVALGTDYDGAPNVNFDLGMPIHEIEWMQEAGMTPMQIIVAATRNAAHVCNLDDEIGTLQAGKIADVLVIDGNPLQDVHALLNVRLVIHDGRVIREGK